MYACTTAHQDTVSRPGSATYYHCCLRSENMSICSRCMVTHHVYVQLRWSFPGVRRPACRHMHRDGGVRDAAGGMVGVGGGMTQCATRRCRKCLGPKHTPEGSQGIDAHTATALQDDVGRQHRVVGPDVPVQGVRIGGAISTHTPMDTRVRSTNARWSSAPLWRAADEEPVGAWCPPHSVAQDQAVL
jgi:hypothetical protein